MKQYLLILFFFILLLPGYSQCSVNGTGGSISAGSSVTYSLTDCGPCTSCNSPNYWYIYLPPGGDITISGTNYTSSPVSINSNSNINITFNTVGNYSISWEWGSSTCSPSCPGGGATFGGNTTVTGCSTPNPCWSPIDTLCNDNNLLNLNTLLCGGSTTGGTWSGTGVTGNNLDPDGLSGQLIAITYTAGSAPCDTFQTHDIFIIENPPPTGGNTSITNCGIKCIDLNSGHSCSNSILTWYSIPNPTITSSSISNPSNVCPTTSIIYYGFCVENLFPSGCEFSSSINTEINVLPISDPCWTPPTSVCISNGLINLNSLLCVSATPGGVWSGTGVFGNDFSPLGYAGQTINITYTVGNSPCDTFQVHPITILAEPNSCFIPTNPLCENNNTINLNSWLCPGSTTGGTWSGTGVSGTSFNPIGLGGQTIQINYSAGNTLCNANESHPVDISLLPDPCWTFGNSVCETSSPINLNSLLCNNADIGGIWSGTGVTGTSFNPIGLGGQSIQITYTVGPNYCDSSQTKTINVTTKPNRPNGNTIAITICENKCFNLTSGRLCSSGVLQWYDIQNPTINDSPINGSQNICPVSSTTYYGFCVDNTNPTECQFSESVETQITLIPSSNPCWNFPTTICNNGGNINLNNWLCNSSTTGGTWSGNGITGNTLDPSTYGAQSIQITYTVGNYPCDTFLTQDVIITESNAEFSTNDFCFGEEFNSITITGPQGGIFTLENVLTGYETINSNTGVIPNPSLNHTYTIKYKVNSPCVDSSYEQVTALECDSLKSILYVPNSFTPNNDNFNDVFLPITRNLSDYKLLIFNRWGQLLFETSDTKLGWNGYFNGTKSQTDTYIWKISYKEATNINVVTKIGHVNIIK